MLGREISWAAWVAQAEQAEEVAERNSSVFDSPLAVM
jgi:hypothetical protein